MSRPAGFEARDLIRAILGVFYNDNEEVRRRNYEADRLAQTRRTARDTRDRYHQTRPGARTVWLWKQREAQRRENLVNQRNMLRHVLSNNQFQYRPLRVRWNERTHNYDYRYTDHPVLRPRPTRSRFLPGPPKRDPPYRRPRR